MNLGFMFRSSLFQVMTGCLHLVRIISHRTWSLDPTDRCIREEAIDVLNDLQGRRKRVATWSCSCVGKVLRIITCRYHMYSTQILLYRFLYIVYIYIVCIYIYNVSSPHPNIQTRHNRTIYRRLYGIAIERRRCLDQKQLRHFGSRASGSGRWSGQRLCKSLQYRIIIWMIYIYIM